MQEIADAGRPKKKNIGFSQAYKKLFPNSEETWDELKKKVDGVSADLMAQVTVKKNEMIAEVDSDIATWDDGHPDLAQKYKDYRAEQRSKDQFRRASKKRNSNDDDVLANSEAVAQIAMWKEKYMCSLEENRQQQTAMLGLAKKLDGPSGCSTVVSDYEQKTKLELCQSSLVERDDVIADLEKRLAKKKSILKAKNMDNHRLETELKKYKKAKPLSKVDSDEEGSEE